MVKLSYEEMTKKKCPDFFNKPSEEQFCIGRECIACQQLGPWDDEIVYKTDINEDLTGKGFERDKSRDRDYIITLGPLGFGQKKEKLEKPELCWIKKYYHCTKHNPQL